MFTTAADFLKQQNNPKKKSGFTTAAQFLKKQNDVPTSWKERLTGTPTKLKDGTYKANTGVLPFLAEVPKTLVSGTIGTGKTLGESMAVNEGAFDNLNKANLETENIKLALVKKIIENKKLGKDNTKLIKEYNRLYPSDSIESLAPNSQISNLEALGNIGMLATEVTSPSAIARSGTAFGYLGKEAGKEALKTLTKEQLKKQLIKEIAFNTAQGYITDVSMNAQNNKVDFKPGIGTALGFGLTGLVGNQAYNKTLNEQSAARIEKKLNQGFNIPAAGTKFDNAFRSKQTFADNLKNQEVNINPKNNILDDGFTPGTDKTPNINMNEGAFVPTPKAEPKSILEGRAFVNPNKNDFIGQEIQRLQKAGAKIPSNAQKIASEAWDRMHPIADTSKIKNIPTESPVNKGLNETQITDTPKIDQPGVNPQETIQPTPKSLNESVDEIEVKAQEEINNDPLKVDSINLKAEGEKAKVVINSVGTEKARRIALGIEEPPRGVRAGAVHSELVNMAYKNGDHELGAELAMSDIFKPSAQEINLARNREPNNFYWVVKDIADARRNGRNAVVKMNEKTEINSIANKLRKTIETTVLDNMSIRKLAAKLICK